MNRITLPTAAFALLFSISSTFAQTETASLSDQLEARKAAFAESAPPEMIDRFAQANDEVAVSGVLESALRVGDRAPDFTLPNADGSSVSLSELLEDGPVVLAWYRGSWCPYCSIELDALRAAIPELRNAGGSLVAISPELPNPEEDARQIRGLDFPVLSDAGNAVAREYGIVFTLPDSIRGIYMERLGLATFNGDDSGELPLAVTYVVNTDGIITYAFVDHDYTKRAEPSEVVAAVAALGDR